jgi:hypothetical protein
MTTLWQATATTNTQAGSQHRVTVDVARYVNKVDDSGWVRVLDEVGANQVLCEFTKVILIGSKAGRTYFKVADGTNKGKTCSLKDENALIYLGKQAPRQQGATIEVTYGKREVWYSTVRKTNYDQQLAEVFVDGVKVLATLNSIWNTPEKYVPIPRGRYKIKIPDYPHDANMTRFYRSAAPDLMFDQVWFPIDFDNESRYVHVGNVSEGCVTILDLTKWTDLYRRIVGCRIPGTNYVGEIVVK